MVNLNRHYRLRDKVTHPTKGHSAATSLFIEAKSMKYSHYLEMGYI